MITDTDIARMRVAAANNQYVFDVLNDIAAGHDYYIPKTCQCGWERMIQSRKPQFTGTFCIHCISVELANVTNDTEEL